MDETTWFIPILIILISFHTNFNFRERARKFVAKVKKITRKLLGSDKGNAREAPVGDNGEGGTEFNPCEWNSRQVNNRRPSIFPHFSEGLSLEIFLKIVYMLWIHRSFPFSMSFPIFRRGD